MNIGIIVYSKTGNTNYVAEQICERLVQDGFSAAVERFSVLSPDDPKAKLRLTATPDPNRYDALIFGAPVQAFSLDPAMTAYLSQIGALKPTKTLCFITQHFKSALFGGNNATKQLLSLLKGKGIAAKPMGVVNWSGEKKDDQIAKIVQLCSEAFREDRA